MTYIRVKLTKPRLTQKQVEIECANPSCGIKFNCSEVKANQGRKYCGMECNLQDRFNK